jgi:hypothetical protein
MFTKTLGLSDTMGTILEVTLTLILVYLILSRADGFSTAMRSLGGVYIGAVKALQGR